MRTGRFVVTIAIAVMVVTSANSQTALPEILTKGSIPDQLLYLENRTTIYENYRAVREDMFQLLKKNTIDSLSLARKNFSDISRNYQELNASFDSLTATHDVLREELREMTRTKNAIAILGITINKKVYNSIVWIIIAALGFIIATGYFALKRSIVITINTKTELADLKKEFDEYRNKSRLEREKMSMDHFKEVQKLKGK